LSHPNSEKSSEPRINLPQAPFTPRSIIGKHNGLTSNVRPFITQLPKDRIRAGMTRLLALTPSPEQFESRTGGCRERGVEADVKDTSIAGLGCRDPHVTAAKDIGVGGTLGQDFGDGAAGFAAGVGWRCLARLEVRPFREIVGIPRESDGDESEREKS
jgi:hypothetical protein